jgi:CRISPR-associated protein Cas1
MSNLYITEKGIKISTNQGRLVLTPQNGEVMNVPFAEVDSLTITEGVSLTSNSVIALLQNGIPCTYMSGKGKVYGRLNSTKHVDIERQRKQFRLGEDSAFCLEISKKIISAKINNQTVLLKRYNRIRQNQDVENLIQKISLLHNPLERSTTIPELLGFEGMAARHYFEALAKLVPEAIKFSGRNRMPPTDEFNSLLSYGYTILLYEIFTAIENKGLNPYAGYLHKDKRGHPALASDLLEEWRSVIIDSLVMNMVLNFHIQPNDFERDNASRAVYINKLGKQKFIRALEKKLDVEVAYFDNEKTSFRKGITIQVMKLVKTIEEENAEIYSPIKIR